jgi:SPP1 family predicted phage head-tail adaptor
MNDILTLIKQIQGVDEYGDPAITETSREVFCRLASIGQKEFYQAHAVGLQPEIKFVLADYLDYSGEALVEHDGQRYRVLRTYRSGIELELVCYREVNAA